MNIDLKTDSRKVKNGDTFIAIKNVDRDGHDYIESAIENGAKKIICEHGNYSVETEVVKDTREYLNDYLYKNYYPLFRDIKLIGITGTNGKTTSSYLTYQMLNLLGKKTAYIGTIGFYCNNDKKELNNTTPDIDLLYEMFLEAKEKDCEYLVMEVSSHALDKDRVHGLEFDEVAFTNLTQDHLDYHKTIENYANAKKILFTKTRDKKIAIINSDDPSYKTFMLNGNNNVTFGTNGDAKFKNLILSNQGSSFTLEYSNNSYNIDTDLVGKFNVYNFLTSLLLVANLGFEIESILNISNKLNHPPGRMEMIKYKTNSIFVDYAHTPDAVSNVINSTIEYKKAKVITILGCGGDRDRTKRPIMGNIATELSDYVIFTNDNPRTEDEKTIMKDIIDGVKKDNYEVNHNRKEAIEKGIDMLKDNDILLILGKGHEDYQIIGKEKIHFSDKEVVENKIKNIE